jgi:hypothetical protein
MQYKTIVLRLLEQRAATYEQLRQRRQLLATLNCLAAEMKASHESWKCRVLPASV